MIPAAIYARQSKTLEGSESLAIQVEQCREAAPRLGLTVVGEYVEAPSTSGYKNRGRGRPEFKRLLDDVRSGQVRAILVYKSERLSRGGGPGWAPVFDAIDAAGIDTDRAVATPGGWMSEFEIGIRATMDREESKKLSSRMADVHAREARAGQPRWGGLRPFGYSDLLTVDEAEAAMIRSAAARVLAGETCWGIARDWNSKGITNGSGAHWQAQTLKRVLRSGRVAGLREHRGTVVGAAAWPAILDRETWERVVAAVNVTAQGPRRAFRTRLLSGILRCGRCGGAMIGRTRQGGREEYVCQTPESSGQATNCGGTVILGLPVDDDVLEVVIGAITDPHMLSKLAAAAPQPDSPGPGLGEQLSVLAERGRRLNDLWIDGAITRAEHAERREAMDTEATALYAKLEAGTRPALVGIPHTEPEFRARWESEGVEWQRLVIRAVIDRLTVAPGRALRVADRLSYVLR